MTDPNDQTIQTYSERFSEYEAHTPKTHTEELKKWIDQFISLLPKNGHILELGAAFGRDTKYFKEHGFSVLASDIVPKVLEQLSQDGFETELYDFREPLKERWYGAFDGMFANAVFLHAKPETLKNRLIEMAQAIKENGVIALSFKKGVGEEISNAKLDAPRYFKYYEEKELLTLFNETHLKPVTIYHDTPTEYSPQGWIQVILKRKNSL